MQLTIEPGKISGIVKAPPSKSHTQRAYAAALLHKGTSTITGVGVSKDELAALDIIRCLGAIVASETLADNTKTAIVFGGGVQPQINTINCGESGLATRLFLPIAALSHSTTTFTGTGSLLKRPMNSVVSVLKQLGAEVSGTNGCLPITINGPILPASFGFDAANSSQLLTGLLFALTAVATQKIEISVSGLVSRPYIDLTLQVLAQCGKPVQCSNYQSFTIDPALFVPAKDLELLIEGDWSAAAFLLVAGAIAGRVTVANLNPASVQADRAILDVLTTAGAMVTVDNDQVTVSAQSLREFDFDATDCPDLFPILAVLAGCCEGECSIAGLHRLFDKESNRVESIGELLIRLDVPFMMADDVLYITGVRRFSACDINGYNDHRIVMAAAVAALRANGPVTISGTEASQKSYPSFFDDMEMLGMRIAKQW